MSRKENTPIFLSNQDDIVPTSSDTSETSSANNMSPPKNSKKKFIKKAMKRSLSKKPIDGRSSSDMEHRTTQDRHLAPKCQDNQGLMSAPPNHNLTSHPNHNLTSRPNHNLASRPNNIDRRDEEVEVIHNISPADLRNLLGMMDDDTAHSQQDIINEYRMYLNNLDWKSGLKHSEVRKYKKMWDEICDAIVYMPLISDVLRLKIGIQEKADFVHKLLILYNMPMDSFEYIQVKRTLLNQFKKYETTQLTPQQLVHYAELEKRLTDIAEYQSALKYTILGSNMIEKNKSFVYTRYQQSLSDPENSKLRTWINTAVSLPTTPHTTMAFKRLTPRTIDKFLCDIKSTLDIELYGMDAVKEQLIFFINNKITRQDTSGAALALEGLPGIGKTCIIQALAKALDLPMVTIPIGGAKDSSFLTGFSYTYEGAQPGAIVQALQELKCTNGIIFIDEIDKIPQTDKGNEISKALLHIIDPAQNHAFHDKYMSNQFDIDLSKIWFIYTLNDRNDIERTLRDRIPIIRVAGYTFQEKCAIAQNHLIPQALANVNIDTNDVQFNRDSIVYMINMLQEARLEIADSNGRSGVRQLKYLIGHIAMKLNLLRNLWDPSQKYVRKLQLSFDVVNFKLPLTVTPEVIMQLDVGDFQARDSTTHLSMYC
jgi:ATP-dependent Lon protease